MKVHISYFKGTGRDRQRVDAAELADWARIVPEAPLSAEQEQKLAELLRKKGFVTFAPARFGGGYIAGRASEIIEL